MKIVAFICGLVIAGVLVLIGYAIWFEANDPGHGRVTAKHYDPPRDWLFCHLVGKVTICEPRRDPECYKIEYTDGHHDGDTCVTATDYDQYEVGSYYPLGYKPAGAS